MNILITGCNGFIGSNLVNRLLSDGRHGIAGIDNFSSGDASYISGIPVDPIDVIDIVSTYGCDVVVHLAAIPGVRASEADPTGVFDTNVRGSIAVLEACRKFGAHFVFASSNAVDDMMSPYAASKAAIEAYATAYRKTYDVPTTCLRFANVYGENSAHKTSVVARFVRQGMQDKPLIVHGNGEQVRDFVYVGDVCDAVITAIDKRVCGTIPIGTGTSTSINNLAYLVSDKFGVEVLRDCSLNSGTQDVRVDTSFAQVAMGWRSKTNLINGLDKTITWFEEFYNGKNS